MKPYEKRVFAIHEKVVVFIRGVESVMMKLIDLFSAPHYYTPTRAKYEIISEGLFDGKSIWITYH